MDKYLDFQRKEMKSTEKLIDESFSQENDREKRTIKKIPVVKLKRERKELLYEESPVTIRHNSMMQSKSSQTLAKRMPTPRDLEHILRTTPKTGYRKPPENRRELSRSMSEFLPTAIKPRISNSMQKINIKNGRLENPGLNLNAT